MRKIKNNVICLYLRSCLCRHYGVLNNNNISPNRQSSLLRYLKISLTWFLPVSVLKESCEHDSLLSKQKLCYRVRRIFSKFSEKLHIHILKYFHNDLMCIASSNYYENSKILSFLVIVLARLV